MSIRNDNRALRADAATVATERKREQDEHEALVANQQRVVRSMANDTNNIITTVINALQGLGERVGRGRLEQRCNDTGIDQEARPGDNSSSGSHRSDGDSGGRSGSHNSDDDVPISNMAQAGGDDAT